MNAFIAKRIGRNRQAGMSLIELMIAMTVLVVGMLALMTLVTTAISSNNRNKLDATGTMLAQTVLEGIASQPASAGVTFTMTDCNPAGATGWTIATAGPATIGNSLGADVVASTGNIDFTQPYSSVTANYAMKYVTCGIGGTQSTYDVRWNVQTLTAFTKLITVSARQLGVPTTYGANLPFFSPPITLRTIAGQ